MAKANRITWEREGILEQIWVDGHATLARGKFTLLAGYTNLYPGVYQVWLEHWREYCSDEDEDLNIIVSPPVIFIYRSLEREGTLSHFAGLNQ